jgi:hypothetical protein
MDQITTGAALKPIVEAIAPTLRNGAGVLIDKLHESPGRPKGARNLHAKHPSSLAKRLKLHGVDWVQCLAMAIKLANDNTLKPGPRDQARDDVRMWLRALPYLVTTTNTVKVKKWKGKASKAALVALNALEGR